VAYFKTHPESELGASWNSALRLIAKGCCFSILPRYFIFTRE
jgi:hypothetical protein